LKFQLLALLKDRYIKDTSYSALSIDNIQWLELCIFNIVDGVYCSLAPNRRGSFRNV